MRARSSTSAGRTRSGRPRSRGARPLLTVIGAINWDTTLFVERAAAPGEEVPVAKVEEGPGGKGGNVATAAARLVGRGRVAFVGAVGDDRPGTSLRDSLDSEGVLTGGLATLKGSPSGSARIVVDRSGGKTIYTHFGANDRLRASDLEARGASFALGSSFAVVVMDSPVNAALAAARAAKAAGASLFYSPGVRSKEGVAKLEGILALADTVVVDRIELLNLHGGATPREALAGIMERFPSLTVVATLGPSGSLVGKGGSMAGVRPIHLEDLGLSAVNSTGSGDAFLAAYVCYTRFGYQPEEAAYWGNLAGALKAADARTRGSPTKRSLDSKMASLRPP